jgi:hypothetical protein
MAERFSEQPILSIDQLGASMTITLRVGPPIASMEFFRGVVALLSARMDELRQPSAGDLEIASWVAAHPDSAEGGDASRQDAGDRP